MEKKITDKQLEKIIKESIKKVLKEEISFKVEDYFDLSKFSKEQLLSMVTDMRNIIHGSGYGNKLLYDKDEILNESADRTLNIDELKTELNKSLGIEDFQIKTHIYANNIKVIILYADVAKNSECIIKEMESCGWSLARKSDPTLYNGYYYRIFEFDPIFQDNVNKEVRQEQYLYHWTPEYNLSNIMRSGLEARNGNTLLLYPPHVHLMKSNISEKDAKYLGWQLFKKNNNPNNNGNYILLQIEINKVPEDVDFFYDPRYEMGYYTKVNIPGSAIKAIGKIHFSDAYDRNSKIVPIN